MAARRTYETGVRDAIGVVQQEADHTAALLGARTYEQGGIPRLVEYTEEQRQALREKLCTLARIARDIEVVLLNS